MARHGHPQLSIKRRRLVEKPSYLSRAGANQSRERVPLFTLRTLTVLPVQCIRVRRRQSRRQLEDGHRPGQFLDRESSATRKVFRANPHAESGRHAKAGCWHLSADQQGQSSPTRSRRGFRSYRAHRHLHDDATLSYEVEAPPTPRLGSRVSCCLESCEQKQTKEKKA